MVDSGSTLRTVTIVLVISAGIAFIGTEVFGSVASLGTVWSSIALTALASPLTYACYRVSRSVSAPTNTRTNDAGEMSAEEVKLRTERWSEEAAINPAFPPGQGPDQQSAASGQNGPMSSVNDPEPNRTEKRNREASQRSSSFDPSDVEFAWQTETDVSFDDLGGMDELKDELRTEVIQPIEHPEEAEKLGVSAPNVLFTGPPGTGKSYSAKALATELRLPFVSLSGADIQSKWINESASIVNDLFSEAKEMADREGGAVVFLDEIDS